MRAHCCRRKANPTQESDTKRHSSCSPHRRGHQASRKRVSGRQTFEIKYLHFLFPRFSLDPSEVGRKMEGVPIEDTMLSDMCPDIESAFCFPHKYRTINGECNNVKNPTWGITGAAYLRILQPTYQDGRWRIFSPCGFALRLGGSN